MERRHGTGGWNVWRGIVGFFYLAAALFNGFYTIPRAEEAIDTYADEAWFSVVGDLLRDAASNPELFIGLVVVFEIVVGVLILSKEEYVTAGIWLSLAWVTSILLFLQWPYFLVNLALFVGQGAVLLRRYDTPIWELALPGGARHGTA